MNSEEAIRKLKSNRENIWLPVRIGDAIVEIKMRAKDLIKVVDQNNLSMEIRTSPDYTNRTYTFNSEKGIRVFLKETNGPMPRKDSASMRN